jgi:ParB family transcriptional regulator, chromosome partitioning protein
MANYSRGTLGRGLDALIPRSPEGVQQVDIDRIAPNPEQPRTSTDPAALEELSQSIREHGLLQPLIVTRQVSSTGAFSYQLIAGERRLQAARLAGLERVPVFVREVTDQGRLELALVENLQRADLGPLEEAKAYQRLIDDFGLTQEEVAQRVGRGRVAVANAVRLLGLSPAIKASLTKGEITAGHARALLGADDETARLRILDLIREQNLNVRQAEALVRAEREQRSTLPSARTAARSPDRELAALEEQLSAALSTQVQLFPGRRGGRIVIRYYGDEELQEILTVLLQGRE